MDPRQSTDAPPPSVSHTHIHFRELIGKLQNIKSNNIHLKTQYFCQLYICWFVRLQMIPYFHMECGIVATYAFQSNPVIKSTIHTWSNILPVMMGPYVLLPLLTECTTNANMITVFCWQPCRLFTLQEVYAYISKTPWGLAAHICQ